MAEPLARAPDPGAMAVLEEAAQLLRQSTFSVLLYHWLGSVPFALGLLGFWNSLTTQRLTDRECATQALLVTVLLLWMNCWRAVFAGRLVRQLSGTPITPWTMRRVANLVANQSFLGAIKLVILPLAGLVLFPLANTVAFFRNASALADREDLDPLQLIAKSRDLAQVHQRQSWAVLPVLSLLQLVIAANLALVYAALPFLVRMLTGVESDFNRGANFYVQSPLFVVFVLLSAWAAFDPFVQAVYCVRCFHGESVATGEDLRVGLRRLRAAKALAALALLAIVPRLWADGVAQQELQQASRRAMQAPEYGWRIPPPPETAGSNRPWVLRAADKILEAINSMWRAIGKALGKVVDWLFGKLGGSSPSGEGAAPGAGLHWSIYLLMAALALAGILMALRLRRGSKTQATPSAATPVRLDEEGVTADQLPEEQWIALALECIRQENYRLALRAYYLASLAWLGQSGFIAIHSGKTNREYELELRRKARQFTEARGLFGANVSAFEAVWYGMHEVSGEGVAKFRERLEGMKKVMA